MNLNDLFEGAFSRKAQFAGALGFAWTAFWLLLPLQLLFHGPFLRGVLWPLVGIGMP